ncbi:hypothetical protein [Streptomyces tendae]|uniref:hypothetical protein n=1 Tax=Streptomyces tendae TaxID=1932 RepID=UPI00367BECE5
MQVEIEGTDGQEDAGVVRAGAALVAVPPLDGLAPLVIDLWAQRQVLLSRVDLLDPGPERVRELAGQGRDGGVVAAGPAPGQVVDQQPADALVLDGVAVDELGDGELAAMGRNHRSRSLA